MQDSSYNAPDLNRDGEPSLTPESTAKLRGLQIITVCLIMGSCLFMLVTLFFSEGALELNPDILSWIAVGFAVFVFLLSFVFPGNMLRRQLSEVDVSDFENKLPADRQTDLLTLFHGPHIVACAMFEGAVFFNLVAYMVTPFAGNIGAAIFLILVMAARFPIRVRITKWINDISHEFAVR